MPKGVKGFQKGHPVPESVRRRVSESRKGHKQSPETIAKRVAKLKGKTGHVWTDEQRKAARLRVLGSKQSPELIAKRFASRRGYRHSEETRSRIAESQKEERSAQWKGDKVGYHGLHSWVYRKLGRAEICSNCDSTINVEWSNVSHSYKRDVNDWQQLCARCHRAYDKGRNDIRLLFGVV